MYLIDPCFEHCRQTEPIERTLKYEKVAPLHFVHLRSNEWVKPVIIVCMDFFILTAKEKVAEFQTQDIVMGYRELI